MKGLIRQSLILTLMALLCLEAIPNEASAQATRLAGRVTDVATDEPVPGASVLVVDTDFGAAADLDGRYSIIGLSPGTYTVRVSAVGYATTFVEGVLITSARTTTQNVELTEEVIEGQELIVEAVRPVVDANQTSSRALVTAEEMQRLPVTSLQDVIARTANSYEGFIRGSRRFETRTIMEGIDVSDAFWTLSSQQAGAYPGATYSNTNRAGETNPSMFNISPDAVEELTVNAGATDSRYTSASGGVVAVTLADGRGPLRGTFSARVAPQINRPGPDSLDFYFDADVYFAERDELIAAGDPKAELYQWTPDRYSAGENPEMDIRGSVGGSISDDLHMLVSGQFFRTHGYMPNEFRQRFNAHLKSTYQVADDTRLEVIGMLEDRGMWFGWKNRNFLDFWRFNLDGVAQNDGGKYLGSLKLTQVLTPNSFLDVQVYRTYQRTRYGYTDENGDFLDFKDPQVIQDQIGFPFLGQAPDRSKRFFHNISDPWGDTGIFLPSGLRYRQAHPVVYSEDVISATNGARVDFSSQVTYNHFVQLGTELKLRNFEYDEIYGVDGTGFTLNQARPGDPSFVPEPYIPRQWSRSPWELSVYAADRMEYAGLIVNLGLRVDVVDRDTERYTDHFYPLRRDTIDVNGRLLWRNFARRGESVPIDVFWNPSIGVSHPIGASGAMYFSYNRAQQLVPYSRLYQMYDGNHSRSGFFTFSDPAQRPVTSNNYEVGGQWEFAEGWGVDVNAYMRSIDNYGEAGFQADDRTPEGEHNLENITFYLYTTSFGYADVRGIEFVLRRRALQLTPDVRLGLTASYTFSAVERANNIGGVNQNRFAYDADTGETQLPFENTQDWKHFVQNVRGGASTIEAGYDRSHRGVLRAIADLPAGFSLGLTGAIESGFLYPRVLGADPRDRELLTGPTNHQFDLRIENRIDFGTAALDLFLDVTNLLNTQNIVAYESHTASGPPTFQETGRPGQRLTLPDGSSIYGPARNIYFGTRVRF